MDSTTDSMEMGLDGFRELVMDREDWHAVCSSWGHKELDTAEHLQELAQTHVHQVSDAIRPSDPLSSLYHPPVFNLSQHQGLFK